MAELKWYENIKLESIKNIIKDDINTASRSFVAIGYFLKNIRDRELYLEDGYQSIWEFAKCEFGIGKSSACSFMAVNDKFSVDGNSPTLLTEYRSFSSSKLSEMLTLTDEQLKQISENTTRAEIREIKKSNNAILHAEQDDKTDKSVATHQESIPVENIDFTRSINSLAKEYETMGSCPPTVHSCIRGDSDGDEGKKLCTECWKKHLEQEKVLASISKAEVLEQEEESIETILEEDITTVEIVEGIVEQSEILEAEDEQFIELNEINTTSLAKDMLKKHKHRLEVTLRVVSHNQVKSNNDLLYIEKCKLEVAAFEKLTNDLENMPVLEEKKEQPELPALRNNDQRKEFIETYETWPIWIDNLLTQERYYRYDFDNGTSFIIRVSMVHKWDKGRYSKEAEWGREEYFLLGEFDHSFPGGKSFTESSTNKSYMVEYLKNIQKK